MRYLVVVLLVALSVACGGSDDKKAPPLAFDPKQASTALLDASELQGTGWLGQPTDFGEPALARSPLCTKVSDFDRHLIDGASGKAARGFQRTASPVQIAQYVYIYDTPAQAQQHVEAFRALGDWSECISFVLAAGSPQRFTSSAVSPGGTVPPGAAAQAFESRRPDGQLVRSVFFIWQEGNAVGWISFLGPSSSLNDALIVPVLNSAASALRETGEGKRVPPRAGATPAPA